MELYLSRAEIMHVFEYLAVRTESVPFGETNGHVFYSQCESNSQFSPVARAVVVRDEQVKRTISWPLRVAL
jgi:hypothetical protein